MIRFLGLDFDFYPHRLAAETGAWERGWVVMLSEHPNVRVHDDPATYVPVEGILTLVGTRNARGDFEANKKGLPAAHFGSLSQPSRLAAIALWTSKEMNNKF